MCNVDVSTLQRKHTQGYNEPHIKYHVSKLRKLNIENAVRSVQSYYLLNSRIEKK